MRPCCKTLGEAGELLCRSEQSWVDEVEDGPQITQAVLNRRAGEREFRSRIEFLDDPCLLGVWILDRLRFIENNKVPCGFREPRNAQQRTVTRNHQIHIPQMFPGKRFKIWARAWPMDEQSAASGPE